MVVLDRPVRKVVVQFSCSNHDFVLRELPNHGKETTTQFSHRTDRAHNGVLIAEPTVPCWIGDLSPGIEGDYPIVDAFTEERIDQKDPQRTYHIIRFIGLRRELAGTWPLIGGHAHLEDNAMYMFERLTQSFLWHVRVYANPNDSTGEIVVSINCGARQPLWLPDGQPVVVWRKDENGKRIGERPLPLAEHPHPRITVRDDTIAIATA